MPVETKFLGTSVGNVKFKTDPAGNNQPAVLSECTTGRLTGEITENAAAVVEGTISTATFLGTGAELAGMKECTSTAGILGNLTVTINGGGTDGEAVNAGTPWCLKAVAAGNAVTIRGGACGAMARKITIILDATKLVEPTKFNECKYERAAAIAGTYTKEATGDAIVSFPVGPAQAEKEKTTFTGEVGNSIECPVTLTWEMTFTLETDKEAAEPFYIS